MGLYWLVLFQLIAGIVLLRSHSDDRFAWRILGTLFLLNAAISALMLLPRGETLWLRSDVGALTRLVRALDAPTGPLLIALVLAAAGGARRRIAAVAFVILAGVVGVLEFPFHRFLAWNDHYVRALPYYIGLGAAAWSLAGGEGWRRWVALALLPRALYWGTAGLLEVASNGLGSEPAVYVNRIGLLGLLAMSAAASVRLARGRGEPHLSIVVAVLAIGPLATILETAVAGVLPPEASFRYGTVVIINLLTLGVVRPALTMLGTSPAMLVPMAVRTTIASSIGALSAMVFAPGLTMPAETATAVAFGMGLGVACVAVAVLEGIRAPQRRSAVASEGEDDVGADVTGAGSVVGMVGSSTPQWQRLLLDLRGSSRSDEDGGRGVAHLTQKALVARTGIGAPRISVLTRELNEDAVARLDAYVPGWRTARTSDAPIELVRRYNGVVPGARGVRVYYRLTELGEMLAQALHGQVAPVPAPTTDASGAGLANA